MRRNTQKIYERLFKGAFLSVDSADLEVKHLYADVEETYEEYYNYFAEIGFLLESGDGYFFFARQNESKATIEQKLSSFSDWIDRLDFLKTFDVAFSVGYQFRVSSLIERINSDVELKEKARRLFSKQNTNQEVAQKMADELVKMGFADTINEQEGTYKVNSAFRYAEEMVNLITIYNEEEVPES